MSKHTVVISFEDGKEPTYHAGMQVLGGFVDAVQFSDALEEMQLLEEQRDELMEGLEACKAVLHSLGQTTGGAYQQADTAIAKARGTPC